MVVFEPNFVGVMQTLLQKSSLLIDGISVFDQILNLDFHPCSDIVRLGDNTKTVDQEL